MSLLAKELTTLEYFRGSGIFAKNRTQAHFTNIIVCAAVGYTRLADLEIDYATIRNINVIILVALLIQWPSR